jgi:predicted phosphodiesterase
MHVLVVTDIHSNLAALRTVLADAGPVDEIWCLGDLVGYGPQPNECIDLLRQHEPHLLCIPGNHDWAALGKLDISDFNPDAQRAARWTQEHLSASSRTFLEGLPQTQAWGDYTLVHGSLRQPIWEYMVSPLVARDNFPLLKSTYCFMGHSHLPLIFVEAGAGASLPAVIHPTYGKALPLEGKRQFINPGSVGQPRDGDRDASYVLLDTDAATILYRRVAYPLEETQKLMAAAGLPERLIVRLAYGL